MPTIDEIRQKYPEYADMTDASLASALHSKFYSDIPQDQFYKKIGLDTSNDIPKSIGSGLAQGGIDLAVGTFDLGTGLGGYAAKKAVGNSTLGVDPNGKIAKGLDYAFGDKGMGIPQEPQSLSKAAGKAVGVDYKPKTDMGQAAQSVSELAPGAAMLGKGAFDLGKAGYGAAKNFVSESFPKTIIPNADELRSIGSGLYKKAAELGGKIKASTVDSFIDKLKTLKPQTELGKAYAGESDFAKSIDKIEKIMKGKPVSLDEAQELDELLGDEIDAHTEHGVPNKQGKKLLDVQTAFRNMISEAPEEHIEGGKEGFEALKNARMVWSASRRAADIEKIITRAEMSPNPDLAIRSGFRTLYNNQSRMRGFSKEEAAAIKKASDSGIVGDLVGMVGSRLNPIIAHASGAGLGAEALTAGSSIAARGGRSALAMNRAKNAVNTVSENAMNKAGIPFKQGPRLSPALSTPKPGSDGRALTGGAAVNDDLQNQ